MRPLLGVVDCGVKIKRGIIIIRPPKIVPHFAQMKLVDEGWYVINGIWATTLHHSHNHGNFLV
jgi:hypothetical protein